MDGGPAYRQSRRASTDIQLQQPPLRNEPSYSSSHDRLPLPPHPSSHSASQRFQSPTYAVGRTPSGTQVPPGYAQFASGRIMREFSAVAAASATSTALGRAGRPPSTRRAAGGAEAPPAAAQRPARPSHRYASPQPPSGAINLAASYGGGGYASTAANRRPAPAAPAPAPSAPLRSASPVPGPPPLSYTALLQVANGHLSARRAVAVSGDATARSGSRGARSAGRGALSKSVELPSGFRVSTAR